MPAPYAAYVVDTISDLVNPQATGRTEVTVLGYSTKGDGGGGTFYWATGSSYVTDYGTIFPKAAVGANPAGAWLRVINGDFNVKWFGAITDGSADNTTGATSGDLGAIPNAIYAAIAAGRTLVFPAGTYLINHTIQMNDYMYLRGTPGKTVFKTTTPTGLQYMFQNIAHGNIRIEGITFTNNFSTNLLTSFLKFQSSPNKVENIYILSCSLINSYVQDAIEFGYTDSDTNSCYYDNVVIDGCFINNLYGPKGLALPYNQADPGYYYFGPDFCSGIRLVADVLRYTIRNTIIRNVSGDCVCSYGRAPLSDPNYIRHYMEGHIHGCEFYAGNMLLELNGNHSGLSLNVHDNRFFYPNQVGGMAVSVSCEAINFHDNHVYTAERTALEISTVTGTINNNVIKLHCWKDSTTGIQPTGTPPTGSSRVHFMELAGYMVEVSGNICEADRSNATANTPAEFDGISINGKNREQNQCDQRCVYNGISDYAAYWYIKDNVLTGVTHRFIEATIKPIRNVIVEDNNFIFTSIADIPVIIQGYNWQVKNNIFDLKLLTSNPSGIQLVKCHTVQTDATLSLVYDNIVLNDLFNIGNSTNVNYFSNRYQVVSTGVMYNLIPAPALTSAQRTALSPKEGMQVYQTDATVGTYIYTGGAWKRVDLV